MTAHITVVGSLNMDLVTRAPHLPQPGESVIGSDFHTLPGGKGANQAAAAARLGAQTAMVGRVGSDGFGQELRSTLDAAGVDHTFVNQDPEAVTGVALITVDDNGQNTLVVASGANMRLTPQDVETAQAAIAAADVLLLQLESPLESVTRAAQIARAHGVRVILNPAPAHPLPAQLLSLVDVLIPNETETSILTGAPIGEWLQFPPPESDEPPAFRSEAAQGTARKLGVSTVILTLGKYGSLLIPEEGEPLHVPPFRVKAVDATAAGDAFVAAFGVALAEGRAFAEAMRWGNAAGALAATRLGAQPSLPTRQEVGTLIAG
jgi:ribokinase